MAEEYFEYLQGVFLQDVKVRVGKLSKVISEVRGAADNLYFGLGRTGSDGGGDERVVGAAIAVDGFFQVEGSIGFAQLIRL